MSVLMIEGLEVEVKPHFWSNRKQILKGVTFNVDGGEIFGFLGPNGAGKTTTIKTILGLVVPSNGRIRVLGGDINDPGIRSRIGFMPERAYFSEHLTGREVVGQHALLAGLGLGRARSRAQEVLDQVGLGGATEQRLGSYSKGMLQRVGIAQAIVGDPELVILDEPQSGLDPLGRRDIRNLMLSLRQAGKTVFFSTHILPDVEMICDRVAIMVDGVVRTVGELESLVGADEAIAAIEIVAEGCDEATVVAAREAGAVAEQHGQAHRFVCSNHDRANQLVDLLRQSGVVIRSLQSHRRSLEDVFVSEAIARRRREESES